MNLQLITVPSTGEAALAGDGKEKWIRVWAVLEVALPNAPVSELPISTVAAWALTATSRGVTVAASAARAKHPAHRDPPHGREPTPAKRGGQATVPTERSLSSAAGLNRESPG
jgi:hypothetical protein